MSTEILDSFSSTKFIWKIRNLPYLNAEGVCSDVFSVGAFKWRAKIYPKGYGRVYDHLSLFLCPVDLKKSVYTEYSFAVVCQTNCKNKYTKEGDHKFERGNREIGWPEFMRLSDLYDPDKGYITVDDTCIITVEVSCRTNEELDKNLNLELGAAK